MKNGLSIIHYFGPFTAKPGRFIHIRDNSVKYMSNGMPNFTGLPTVLVISIL